MSSFGRFGKSEDHAVREFTICIKPLDGKIHARKRALMVKSWSTVKDLKDILQSLLHLPAASQRLFFRGGELRNPHTLQDCGIYRDGQTVYLASSPQDEMGKPYSLEPFLGAGGLPRSLSRVLGQARRGLDRGFKPELTLEGTGGTYFLQDAARQKVAVFKPQDEEPFAPNNPREAMQGGLGGAEVSMRPGIDAGESYLREVAAYILDDLHLHGVPATTLVEAKHPAFCYWDHKERKKLGSFQEFVRHDMVVEDISPSKLTPREVQKIALLDMRILNRDRNSVNILVRSRPRRSCSFSDRNRQGSGSRHMRQDSSDSSMGQSAAAGGGQTAPVPGEGATPSRSYRGGGGGEDAGGGSARRLTRFQESKTEYELIPIDHGLCLSDELVIDWCDWCWLNWRQVKEPIDPELYNYIQSFNPEMTAEKLGDALNLPESCLKNLRIAETLLKEGVAAGLTLFDIACIIRREDFDQVSELETVVARAHELARAAVDHQTSVAPSKHTFNLASKSLDTSKPARPRPASGGRSESLDLTAEDKKGWLDATKAEEEEALDAEQAPTQPAPYTHESSNDASSEDVPTLSDLRISADSMDGSGGEGCAGERPPLRIWAPPPGTASLSRESPSSGAQVAFLTGQGTRVLGSPPYSAESDTELVSPVGFWREKFETIDARNASRSFSGWEDTSSVDGVSPRKGKGGRGSIGGGAGSCPGWQGGGGRPPLIVGDSNTAAGAPADGAGATAGGTASSAVAASDAAASSPEKDSDSAREMGGARVVGRKLFSSPEKNRAPLVVKGPGGGAISSASLEPMPEDDHESPLPGGSQSGSQNGGSHPCSDAPSRHPPIPPFWVTSAEAAKEKAGAGFQGDKEAAGGLGWRRGDAGLVVPDPLPPKQRSVTIQQVVPQRAPRIGDTPGGGRDGKRPLGGPRPATTSPTLPMAGEQKSKMPKEVQVLTPGVKIVRSYSYHGLGSMALYDSARGSARYSLRKRPNENSEQFKACFFRFLRFLLRDLAKRRHRSIVRERGARAARQAAEKSFKSSGAAAAAAAAAAVAGDGGGRGGRGGRAGDYDADDRLRRRPQPPPPASARGANSTSRSGMPAAVPG